MAQDPKITATLSITTLSLGGSSVASVFPNVLEMKFDFFYGKLQVRDANLGVANFNLNEITAMTYTVAGTVTTIVMS